MTPQELGILIQQTIKTIYSTYNDKNLTDAEFDYFLHSILYTIAIDTRTASKIRLNMEAGDDKMPPMPKWLQDWKYDEDEEITKNK